MAVSMLGVRSSICHTVHTAVGRRASQQWVHQVKRQRLESRPRNPLDVTQDTAETTDAPQPTNAPSLGCQRGSRELQLLAGAA